MLASACYRSAMERKNRTYRLQVDLSEDEKQAIDDFWFRERLPSRAEAMRELLRRALAKDREEEAAN
jgi:metal-responsive CopG/Arc/MetJ family transcriptional regulator